MALNVPILVSHLARDDGGRYKHLATPHLALRPERLEDAGWADPEIRVIVLKAAGRAFSAGFDITTGKNAHAVARRDHFLKGKGFSASGWWDVFWNNPKPIIAQSHGFCIAGGSPPQPFVTCGFARAMPNSVRPRSVPVAPISLRCGLGLWG